MLLAESVQFFLLYIVGSFLLHLAWENLQAPLFSGYESFVQHFPICLGATLTGDMFVMILLYLVLSLAHRDIRFLEKRETYSHPATWVLTPFVGVLFAIIIELRALLDH